MSTARTVTRFAAPILAAATILVGLTGASQTADARRIRYVVATVPVVAVPVVTTRIVRSACWNEWTCVSTRRKEVCRRVTVCD